MVEEVTQWLDSIGLGEYTDTFIKQGYDDLVVISELDDSDLTTLEIKPGHKKKLLLCSAKLKEGGKSTDVVEKAVEPKAKEPVASSPPKKSSTPAKKLSASSSSSSSSPSPSSPPKKSLAASSPSSSSSSPPKKVTKATAPVVSPPSAVPKSMGEKMCRYAPNYACSVTTCALKYLHCGTGYCTACLYSEGGKKMRSLTECAKCKKIPRVQPIAKRSEWKD